jgi:hypothetical protein
MSVDLFSEDFATLSNDERFFAIEDFAKSQAVEGWRHDYTQQWDDSSLKTVAAFAHAFGGVLIIGVKKQKRDLVCELLGVETETEYKTRIASSIASNISPVPPYDIFECYKPDATNKRFCVVRIRQSKTVHLITKKGLSPVYIRNDDESIPANAVELRRLIDREREAPALGSRGAERANQLRDAMGIGCEYRSLDSDRWYLASSRSSPTFVKLMLVPMETVSIELEKFHEEHLRKLIIERYPYIPSCLNQGKALQASRRGADFYDFAVYYSNVDYENRWRVTGLGDIGFATQMACTSKFWSVVDLAHYIILFVKLAIRWWEFIGFLGDCRFFVQLNIPGLDFLRAPEGYYIQGFDASNVPLRAKRDLRKDAILLGTMPGNAANAEIKLNYFSAQESLSKLTTSLLNQLLRSLGHVVDTDILEESIASMAQY